MKLNNNIDYEDIDDNIDDYEYPYNYINRGELIMNKNLVIEVLHAYLTVNDGSLTIVTKYATHNGCRITDIDSRLLYVRHKDGYLYRIKLDDIIGIQFMDMKAAVGMK